MSEPPLNAEKVMVHDPRCNTYCTPGSHHLTSGIGYPHLHRTDLSAGCGECRPSRVTVMICRHCGMEIREGEKSVNWPWIHMTGFYGCAIAEPHGMKAEPLYPPVQKGVGDDA